MYKIFFTFSFLNFSCLSIFFLISFYSFISFYFIFFVIILLFIFSFMYPFFLSFNFLFLTFFSMGPGPIRTLVRPGGPNYKKKKKMWLIKVILINISKVLIDTGCATAAILENGGWNLIFCKLLENRWSYRKFTWVKNYSSSKTA